MSVMDQKARRETDEIVSWIGHYEIGVLALKRETTRRTYTLILQVTFCTCMQMAFRQMFVEKVMETYERRWQTALGEK